MLKSLHPHPKSFQSRVMCEGESALMHSKPFVDLQEIKRYQSWERVLTKSETKTKKTKYCKIMLKSVYMVLNIKWGSTNLCTALIISPPVLHELLMFWWCVDLLVVSLYCLSFELSASNVAAPHTDQTSAQHRSSSQDVTHWIDCGQN